MFRKVLCVNFIGLVLTPLLALINVNPFFFLVLLGLLTSSYFLKMSKGYITAILAWNIGFLFIIGVDGVLNFDDIKSKIGDYPLMVTSILLLSSYYGLNMLYVFFNNQKREVRKNLVQYATSRFDKQKLMNLMAIIVSYAIYLYYTVPNAIDTFLSGRFMRIKGSDFGGLEGASRGLIETFVGYFVSFVGVVLPALIYHYIQTNGRHSRNKFRRALILTAPIFIVQLMLGTRYVVLLSLGTFLVTYLYYNQKTIRKFRYIAITMVVVFLISSAVSTLRGDGLASIFNSSSESIEVNYGRTENTVQYMAMVIDYYSDKSFELGSSSSSIFLFWIPRSIWPEKPTMFGYWFIREYYGRNFDAGSKLSAPASYISEAYSDFGVMGVAAITVILALLFSMIDKRLLDTSAVFTIKRITFYLLVPIVFFLPRGINTPFTNFMGGVFILIFMRVFSKSMLYLREKNVKQISNVAHYNDGAVT